ncbi:MAG: hypothetical protein M1828_005687 [Chrysothrix sp. TS-e1954]|nr:MAG: hypothetical protein M1828_005687 [Chrysothrix sp. TS-e1954]
MRTAQTGTIHHDALKLLAPAVRAYGFGLLSTTFPGLLSLLFSVLRGKVGGQDVVAKITSRISREVALDRWPTTCGILVGSVTVGPLPFLSLLNAWHSSSGRNVTARAKCNVELLIRFLTVFSAALGSFQLLNRRESKEERFQHEEARRQEGFGERDISISNSAQEQEARTRLAKAGSTSTVLAGRTLDITFFSLVRATDVVIYSLWTLFRVPSRGRLDHKRARSLVEHIAPPTVFSMSSAIVMWAWFYQPDRLPRSYRTWISNAAQVDDRLIEALRQLRRGNFVYGQDTGMADLLGSMSKDLGYPTTWGDPAKTVPIPCELYHSGSGPSCEWHAMTRFFQAWQFAMYMYLPLNLLVLARRDDARRASFKALLEASQSSAFLGAFVSLFYYGVCLARTRIGPNVLGHQTVTPMTWDGGLAVANGCALCGWSIMFEKAARRQEVAYFVAPRALATIFPRRYERRLMRREQFAYALSIAIILTAAKNDPGRVRGVFGRLLQRILR